jgi:copper oxidase (laccase) domain-containing protein
MFESTGGFSEQPGLPFRSMPGVEVVAVHPDLQVLESNKLHGNMDPRFSSRSDVQINRITLAGASVCQRFVAMVPQPSDEYKDLDQGPILAPKEGYRNWPEALQPKDDVRYDPDDPPLMIDLPFDGLITRRPGNGLMLNAADCAPTVMYDPRQRVLALAHIGREGAAMDIGPKMVRYLQRNFGTKPADLVVHFGSSIAPESYVLSYIGEALRQEAWRPFLCEVDGGHATDIVGYAVQRLLENKIKAANISRSLVDVATHPEYFSLTAHDQGNGANGRNGFLVTLRQPEVEAP